MLSRWGQKAPLASARFQLPGWCRNRDGRLIEASSRHLLELEAGDQPLAVYLGQEHLDSCLLATGKGAYA